MSFQITPQQADKIGAQLYEAQNYLVRLRKRMRAVGVAENDPIFLAVVKVDDAMVSLRMQLHGRACGKDR